jgi:signal transduction histidine kinase
MRFSVATKIFFTYAAALVAFGAVSTLGVLRLDRLGRELKLLDEGYLPLSRIVAQLDVREWETAKVLSKDPNAQRAFISVARAHYAGVVKLKVAEGHKVLERARAVGGEDGARFLDEATGRLDAIEASWARYDEAAGAHFAVLERTGPESAEAEKSSQEVRSRQSRLRNDVRLLTVSLDEEIADRFHAAERHESRAILTLLIYSVIAIGIGILAALAAQRLLAPIRTLTEGVKAVAGGDLSRKVALDSQDELGLLAREFNAMAASLDRQREQLLRAERLAAIGRISAQITHEIRNPLNAIGLNAELLADALEDGDPTEAKSLVAAIGREVDRLGGITEEYLRFARLPKPVVAREDLNDILSGLLDFLARELQEAKVEVKRELSADLPPIQGDEAQLRAAFLNLVRNSREAMPGGGTLTVRTRLTPDGAVEAEVRDTGLGIPQADLSRIFDPFFSTKERGTGLGLALTLQVAQEHGGQIRCESERGKGTAFFIRLPAARDDRAAPLPIEAARA